MSDRFLNWELVLSGMSKDVLWILHPGALGLR